MPDQPLRHAACVFLLCLLGCPAAARAGTGNYHWLPAVEWTDRTVAISPVPALPTLPEPVPSLLTQDPSRFEVTGLQNEQPPAPRHTGLAALVYTTGADFAAFPRRKSTWVILAIGGAAVAAFHPLDDEIVEARDGKSSPGVFAPGKVLGYGWTQAAAAIGIYVYGRTVHKPGEGKTNRISHLGFDLLRANLVTQALTYGVKYAVQRDRPTGECCSFPSGHASVAFATASVIERHFGYRGAWPTYVIASYIGASRLFENRHYLTDVMFGAALGIASGWTVVGRHGRDQFAMVPYPVKGGMGISVQWRPSAAAPVHATAP
jgi:membrane-associated phospholipid phosphatase